MSRRIGVFGGTFDPIHIGHLVTAINVRHDLRLDEVLLVVANHPWQKQDRELTPAAQRLAMVEAAAAEVEGVTGCAIELEMGGVSYTADTLAELRRREPGAELFVVLGSDAAAGLPTWERVEQVRALATLVVVTRPGAEAAGPPEGWPHERVEVPRLEISSSDLRARAADGRPLDWLVSEPVVRFIGEHDLLRSAPMTDPRPEAVELPPTGDGSRRRRREPGRKTPPEPGRKTPPEPGRKTPRERRPRRRVSVLLGALLAVAAVVAVVAVLFVVQSSDEDTPAGAPGVDATGPRPSALVVERAADGTLQAATLLVEAARTRGGDIVYVPTGTMLEVPTQGLVPLREVADDHLLRLTLENLLGHRFDADVTLEPATLASAAGPSGVDAARPQDSSDTEIARLARRQAFWTAWLSALHAGGSSAAPPPGSLGDAQPIVTALATGAVRHQVLPVDRLGGGASGGELYRVRTPQLDILAAALFPGTKPTARRIAVQVLNGTGRPGVAQSVMPALIEAGARVVLTGNAERFDVATTQLVYYEDRHRDDADALRRAVGVGALVKSPTDLRVVSVTLIVGSDFAAAPAGSPATTQGAPS